MENILESFTELVAAIIAYLITTQFGIGIAGGIVATTFGEKVWAKVKAYLAERQARKEAEVAQKAEILGIDK